LASGKETTIGVKKKELNSPTIPSITAKDILYRPKSYGVRDFIRYKPTKKLTALDIT
jgi:hypothetical protein